MSTPPQPEERKGWYPGKIAKQIRDKIKEKDKEKATVPVEEKVTPDNVAPFTARVSKNPIRVVNPLPTDARTVILGTDDRFSEAAMTADMLVTEQDRQAESNGKIATSDSSLSSSTVLGEVEDWEDHGWYPGKIIKEAVLKRKKHRALSELEPFKPTTETPPSSMDDSSSDHSTSSANSVQNPFQTSWYLGKYLESKNRAAVVGQFHTKRELGHGRHSAVLHAIGRLELSLLESRDVNGRRPYAEISLEGNDRRTNVFLPTGQLDETNLFEFVMTDVTAEIFLFVVDEAVLGKKDAVIGRIVIPIGRYLNAFGPNEPIKEWIDLMPNFETSDGFDNEKFRSGVAHTPRSALVRPEIPLGSLLLQVTVKDLIAPVWQLYFLSTPTHFNAGDYNADNDKSSRDDDPDGSKDKVEVKPEPVDVKEMKYPPVEPRIIRKNQARFSKCMKPDPESVIACFFSPPIACILLPCNIFLWLSKLDYLWAFVPFILLLVYGLICKLIRDNNVSVLLWEDELGDSTIPTTAVAKIKFLKKILAKIQFGLGKASTALEKLVNLWSWDDPVITFISMSFLFIICYIGSLVIRLFSIRWFGLFLTSLPFLLSFARLAKRNRKPSAVAASVNHESEGISKREKLKMILSDLLCLCGPMFQEIVVDPTKVPIFVRNFFMRVPDSLESEHRQICKIVTKQD